MSVAGGIACTTAVATLGVGLIIGGIAVVSYFIYNKIKK
jgi:hypothetical protein